MSDKDMITLVVPIRSRSDKKDAVRKRLVELAGQTVKEEGNICYNVHEEVAAPGDFIIYEKWKNQSALDFHMEQEYLKSFLSDGTELLREEIKGIFCKSLN
ncbi:MAG: hypothetical protein A2017_04945 [Lentisphaerae bacterium GWF2_44_16]|nr:MAG: hypothetical protein A2017_04945 [Lentisphaerae bacterium GWF2_44_16]